MEIDKIKKIIELLESSSLDELTIETDGGKLSLKRSKNVQTTTIPVMNNQQSNVLVENNSSQIEEIDGEKVTSPLVGTFYRSPSPDVEPFVKIGDRVKKGQVLCIVEAMKVMNEVTSPCDGVVTSIIAIDEELLEYNQLIMIIK